MLRNTHGVCLSRVCKGHWSVVCRADRDAIDAVWWEEEAYVHSIKSSKSSDVASPSKSGGGIAAVDGLADTPPGSPMKGLQEQGSASWVDFIGSPTKEMASQKNETLGVLVRGRMFEVDLKRRMMQPCYWPGARHRVLRGTWFVEKQGDYVPVREMIAEKLEQAFLSRAWDPSKGLLKMQRDGRHAARIELTSHQGAVVMYALFYSGYEVYIVWDTSFAWIKKKFSKSGGENRLSLRRGYTEPPTPAALQKEADLAQEKEDEEVATSPTPQSLILAIHGIGQNLSGANIAQDALEMKKALRKVVAKTDKDEDGVQQRIEVLPVQWRKTLNLEIDSLAASLMPPGIPSLRHMLHSTAVEVLFYLTPMHRAAILDSVVNSMNVVYRKFLSRNPEFQGRVSIFAHSLGSVLCWDVLCNQDGGLDMHGSETAGTAWAPNVIDIGKLDFEVDKFIIAGSPLGCFLSLRGVNQSVGTGLGTPSSAALMHCNPNRPGSQDGLPKVNRMYNIFHPYDPVAYRLEPLAYSQEALEGHKQALVELVGGGRRIHIAAQELGDNVSMAASRFGSSIAGAFTFSRKSKEEPSSGDAEEHMSVPEERGKEAGTPGKTSDARQSKPSEGDSLSKVDTNSSIARITGGLLPAEGGRPTRAEGRMDFALQEASLEHQYLAALSAHFMYWNSPDVALFVHRAIHNLDVISGEPLVEEEEDDDECIT